MKSLGTIVLSAGAVALAGQAASGETIAYRQLTHVPTFITQQFGNNALQYGDDITLDGGAQQIARIAINFGDYRNDPLSSIFYTPNLILNLYDLNSSGNVVDSDTGDSVTFTPIGTASNNTSTFHGYDYSAGLRIRDTQQYVTFDFTSQNIVRSTFAVAYNDAAATGGNLSAQGFSVFSSHEGYYFPGVQVGSSRPGYLSNGGFTPFNAYTYVENTGSNSSSFEAQVTVVPEPASIGLLSLGTLAAIRRRR